MFPASCRQSSRARRDAPGARPARHVKTGDIMPKKRRSLKEMVDDPRFISGVYNYCDRWCERCPLTARCLVYATEREQDTEDPGSRDINNRAFWERVEETFREAREMLEEMMQERGIALEPSDPDTERELARRH